ncbi:hypothetical protein G9O61_00g007260, partial [Vairimorpha ceranae]
MENSNESKLFSAIFPTTLNDIKPLRSLNLLKVPIDRLIFSIQNCFAKSSGFFLRISSDIGLFLYSCTSIYILKGFLISSNLPTDI